MLKLLSRFIIVVCLLGLLSPGCGGSGQQASQGNAEALYQEILASQPPAGVDASIYAQLQSELVKALQARNISKAVSKPPLGAENAVNDLAVTDVGGGAVNLTWTYKSVGDYDANGEVGGPDIVPIAMYFGATSADANWAQASIADGDMNGEVGSADITPIAFYYGTTVQGYAVFASADLADYPAVGASNGAGTKDIGYEPLSNSMVNANGRPEFSINVAAHVAGDAYWVAPVDNANAQGVRSNRAELGGAGATLGLDIHLASANQPTAGSGTQADPYVVERMKFYQLQLMHSVEGDVTSHAGTTYQSSDAASSVSNTGNMGVGGLSGDYTVTGNYSGLSALLYFHAEGATGQVTYGLNPATPPLGGIGTQADPFQLDAAGAYDLQVVDLSQPADVTGQAVFTPSTLDVQVDPTGSLIIDPGFSGDFNVDATFNGNPTIPSALFFNASVAGNQDPIASYVYIGSNSGKTPLDLEFDATGSSDVDGSIVLYEWDVDNDGVYDYSSTNPFMEYTHLFSNRDSPQLRVTDDDGATATYSHADGIVVTSGYVWSTPLVSLRGLNGCAIANCDGVPNIAITGNNYVDYLRGRNDVGGAFDTYSNLDYNVEYQGHRAVAVGQDVFTEHLVYIPSDNNYSPAIVNMRYIRSSNEEGSLWPLIGGTVEFRGYNGDVGLQVAINGINIYFVNEDRHLSMYRSTNSGSTWNAAQVAVEDGFWVKADFAVDSIGYPNIAYAANDGRLYYKRATDFAGTTWPAGTTIDDFHPASSIGLAAVSGTNVPCVAYVDLSDIANNNTPIYYCYSRDEAGTQWVAPIEVANPGWSIPRNVALAVINLKPAISYYDSNSGEVMYVRAHNRLGSWWSSSLGCYSGDARNIAMCDVWDNPNIAFNITSDDGATSDGTVYAVQH